MKKPKTFKDYLTEKKNDFTTFFNRQQQTVESLKLIQTSIEHFLAPNLALLMDKIEGSGMEFLGQTIYKRLHDNSWEVRDSVLELLHSIVEISNESKFFVLYKERFVNYVIIKA